MEITIRESTELRPTEDTPKRSLWISNMDLVMARYHVPTIYFFNPNGSSNFMDFKILKGALSKILVPFYPIAGRLGYDENGRLEIVCNGEGVLFIVAEASSSMEHLVGNFSDNSDVMKLIPKIDYSQGISSYPLFAAQVTTFKCGGASLGVAFQHTLGDGMAALHFINSWADTSRGLSPTIMPYMDRTLLAARDPPNPKFHEPQYNPANTTTTHSVSTPQSNSTVFVFKLTADQLSALKAKPNAKFSTYAILSAHLWRCLTKARGLPDDEASKLYIAVDGRSRFRPPLPEGYFGNAILPATPTALAVDLVSEPFTMTITRIQESVKQVDDEYLRSAIDYIEKVDDVSTIVRGAHTYRSPNLAVISWIWLPIYDADFGSGRPIFMGPATIVHEGKIYLIPSPIYDGSLSMVIRLERSQMEIFKELLYAF